LPREGLMKKIHKFLLKSYIGPLLLTFFIVLFILLLQFLWKYIDDLVGKGLSAGVLAELILYASTTLVPMALPLAILLASLMTFGNLGENFELTALKSSGVSLQRIMRPLIILTIAISFLAFFFSNNVMPIANLKMLSLLHDVRQQQPAFNIKEGIFYQGLDDYSIRVQKKDSKRNMLYMILIYDHTNRRGNTSVIAADSGSMSFSPNKQYLLLTLFHGRKYEELQEDMRTKRYKTYPAQKDFFKQETITFDLSGFNFKRSDENLWKENYQMLNVSQLSVSVDSLNQDLQNRRKDFSKTFYRSSLLNRYPINKDTAIFKEQFKVKKSFSIDSVFKQMSSKDYERLLTYSLQYARSAVNYISSTADDQKYREEWIVKHIIEWHKKFTLSIACFILFFIGAPLGAIIRKGGFGMPVVVSVLFFVFYYLLSITGERLAKEGVFNPLEGMWLASAILFPLGVFLTIKATNDSVLFDFTSYSGFFAKIFNRSFFKKNIKQ